MTYAAIWDLDGTLVDSGPFHYQSWAETLARHDIVYTEETFRATFGMNNTGILRLLLGPDAPQELIERIGDEKEELFRRLIAGRLECLPGARELLVTLQEAGFRQGLASSAPQANIDAELVAAGLRPFFFAVLSGAKLPGKPNPAVFLQASGALGVPPSRCVVFEDALAGVQAALAAGMGCIACATTNPLAALSQASLAVESLAQVTLEMVQGVLERGRIDR
jgi:HAD superfamily hydrolase (TIGR01509 family)